MVIPFDPAGMDGWTWRDQANGEVAIVGSACQMATASPNVMVDVELVCPEVEGTLRKSNGSAPQARHNSRKSHEDCGVSFLLFCASWHLHQWSRC